MKRDRKELFAGSHDECRAWVEAQGINARLMEVADLPSPGPHAAVYWKRKAPGERAPKRVEFETRGKFHFEKGNARALVVTYDPHSETLTFRPKGTRQAVSIPIGNAYQGARFTAARAIAHARRQAKKGARK